MKNTSAKETMGSVLPFICDRLSLLEPYVPGEQPQNIANLLKLNTNENPYPPSKNIECAMREFDVAKLARYSDPHCFELKNELARAIGGSPENYTVGNGSDEILALAFLGLCGSGAAFPDITYGFYPVFAQLAGVKTQVIDLRDDFTWRPQDYAHRQETLFIANPNAPTGVLASLDSIRELLEENAKRLLVVDEAYIDFAPKGSSAVSLVDQYENLLVVRTFSKSRSLAGLRVAFAVANPALINTMEALRFSFNPYNVDALAQHLASASLRDVRSFDEACEKIISTRTWTAQQLRTLHFEIIESNANFVFAKPTKLSAQKYVQALRKKGIIVRYFDTPRTHDYVRISIGTQEDMERFVKTTHLIVEEYFN